MASSVSVIRSVIVVSLDQLPLQIPASGTTIVPLPPDVPEELLLLHPLSATDAANRDKSKVAVPKRKSCSQ